MQHSSCLPEIKFQQDRKMQTESKISVVFVAYAFLTFAHICTGTLQPCGEKDDSVYSTYNMLNFVDNPSRFLRLRRSVFTDAGYGSRLQAGSNVARSSHALRSIYGKFGQGKRSIRLPKQMDEDQLEGLQTIQRILSDDGCGYRLQAGENNGYFNDHDGHFGMLRPGKRNMEVTDFDMLDGDNAIKNKRLSTDYGYGSRLQAGRNVAKALDGNGLFGIMGPGKRSYSKQQDIAKRIVSDLGYGSRWQAAENAAKSSNEDLFGAYGPGKRR